MAILVTGGAGYIGSHIVYELLAAGREVVVADSLQAGFREAVPLRARFYALDIRDGAVLSSLFARERIEGVIHLAALSQAGESMTDPLRYYGSNLSGTAALLGAMVKSGVLKLVFSSTAAVYGEPERCPVFETDRTAPTSCYGETKLAAERLLGWVGRAQGLRHVSLRCFNACGAHKSGEIGEAHNPETHLIPLILQVAMGRREAVEIYGEDYPTRDGSCVRDYVHVSDLARAHILALDYLLNGGESGVFNLGNGLGFTVKEVIAAARRVTGHELPTIVRERRCGDAASLVAATGRAQSLLGWRPEHRDLEEMIASAWRRYKRHPNGYAAPKSHGLTAIVKEVAEPLL